MEDNKESPLLSALPPHTDYVSYLTIVEQYLTKDNLEILHKVLQDEILTTNIGWDLILLLVPLLPESKQCLEDVARFGNPREVILKVTEALRMIEFQVQSEALPSSDDKISTTQALSSIGTVKETSESAGASPSLWLEQFSILLSILSILHLRIKTKYPSRFLSTTLRAVLATFSAIEAQKEEAVLAIVQMIKKMAKIARPALPSRSSSGMLASSRISRDAAAADPEASIDTAEDPEEKAMQTRLFQAFTTHVLEDYLLSLPSYKDIPGMALSTRVMEKLHPERIIPHSITLASRFANEPELHEIVDAVGQLVSLAHDLKLTNEEVLRTALTTEAEAGPVVDDDEPPTSSNSIPLSQQGTVLLYAAVQASSVLHGRPSSFASQFAIFPQHHDVLNNALTSGSASIGGTVGNEPLALIDACLALGLLALENDNIGTPSSDDQFTGYLQLTSLLASNCPNANLRGHAHYLTSTILRSHPDEKVRYAFIRDTLERCPFENLKTSAVGWIKGEIVEANITHADMALSPTQSAQNGAPSAFASSIALESLAPFLFPSLHADLIVAPLKDAWMTYQLNASFYLAVINFLYLLITAAPLRENLDVQDIWKENDIGPSFLQPLREAKDRFEKAMATDDTALVEGVDTQGLNEYKAELNVLDESIERVTEAAKLLK